MTFSLQYPPFYNCGFGWYGLVDIFFRQLQDDGLGDGALEYMDKLTQQRAALSQLLAEKQKLLETQEHLKRLRQNDAMTQVLFCYNWCFNSRTKNQKIFIYKSSTTRRGVHVLRKSLVRAHSKRYSLNCPIITITYCDYVDLHFIYLIHTLENLLYKTFVYTKLFVASICCVAISYYAVLFTGSFFI